jgi:hypothetical protein
MSLTISGESGGGDFPKLEPGIYHGTCYSIIDLGESDQEYKGVVSKKKRVHLGFEITEAVDPSNNTVMMEDGRPFGAFKTYTASLFEAATLRKDLESWRGKSFTEEELAGFDMDNLIGCTAKIEIGLTKKSDFGEGGNPKILALREPKEGVQKVETHNDIVLFDIDVYCAEFTGNSSEESKAMCDVFESLNDWHKRDIEASYQWMAAQQKFEDTPVEKLVEETVEETENTDDFDDKIPF